MSLFATPELHAANPPESWEIRRIARGRSVTYCIIIQAGGNPVDTFGTRRDAESTVSNPDSWLRRMYEKERRWYAGESIPGWEPFDRAAHERHMIRVAEIERRRAEINARAAQDRPAVFA